MIRKLFGLSNINFTKDYLLIDNTAICYNDIDLLRLCIPQEGSSFNAIYSSIHFITIFLTTDKPLEISINLSNKEKLELIENIKTFIKDYIIDDYDSEIIDSD